MPAIDGCPLGGLLGSLTGYALLEVVEGGVTGPAEDGDITETDTLNCITYPNTDDVIPVYCCIA